MTIQDVKQIKLADYLQSLGYTPVKQQGRIYHGDSKSCLYIYNKPGIRRA